MSSNCMNDANVLWDANVLCNFYMNGRKFVVDSDTTLHGCCADASLRYVVFGGDPGRFVEAFPQAVRIMRYWNGVPKEKIAELCHTKEEVIAEYIKPLEMCRVVDK